MPKRVAKRLYFSRSAFVVYSRTSSSRDIVSEFITRLLGSAIQQRTPCRERVSYGRSRWSSTCQDSGQRMRSVSKSELEPGSPLTRTRLPNRPGISIPSLGLSSTLVAPKLDPSLEKRSHFSLIVLALSFLSREAVNAMRW